MFVITLTIPFADSTRTYYFGGWEASDVSPDANELLFWRPTLQDAETYCYEHIHEAMCEMLLIRSSEGFSIGLPEDVWHQSGAVHVRDMAQVK